MNLRDEKNKKRVFDRRSFVKIGVIVAAPLVFGSATGCRPTDTLTETVYADWATEVDPNSPTKALKNVAGKEETESLPSLSKKNKKTEKEKKQDPVYDSEEDYVNTDEETAQTEYSKNAKDSTDNSTGTGDKDDDDGKKSTKSDQEGKSSQRSEGKRQAGVGGNAVGSDASRDVTDSPDKSGRVIAFGEIANIVGLLGGKGALWCADDEFIDKAKTLYGSSFSNSIVSGVFGSYRASGKTLSNRKFNKLCKRLDKLDKDKRPVYLIYDGSVGCPLTDDEASALEKDYGITTKYFFLNRVSTLKNSMNYIQKILGTTAQHNAKDRYDAYWDFHDGLLSAVAAANGGVAAWETSDGSTRVDFSDGSKFRASEILDADKARWTLLVTDWDEGVSYSHAGVRTSGGLGISRLGYLWSPVNSYLQYGGVINNAAARFQASAGFKNKTEYYRYVWQMALYYYPPLNSSKWRSLSNASLNKEKDTVSSNADILLRAQAGDFGAGKHGEKRFPTVVAATPRIKTRFERNMSSDSGVYGAHYLATGKTGNNPNNAAMGVSYNGGKSAWWSWVGRECDYDGADEPDSAYRNAGRPFDVVANPHGYYSNWIGGSVESVLEAAWAFETLYQNYESNPKTLSSEYGDTAEDVVSYFYKTFYGQTPSSSMLSKILDGSYAS